MKRGRNTKSALVYRGKGVWEPSEKADICRPRTEAMGETKPADALILDFQTPELWENKCLLFKLPVCAILFWQPEQTEKEDLIKEKKI